MKKRRREFVVWEKAILAQIETCEQSRKCLLKEVETTFALEKALRATLKSARAIELRR